jgi:hypothetical protein
MDRFSNWMFSSRHNSKVVLNGFSSKDGMGLVPKRGCLLTSAYYAFPRWYEFGERRWNEILTGNNRRTREKTCPSATSSSRIPHGLNRARTRASVVCGRRLTTWAMERPFVLNGYDGLQLSRTHDTFHLPLNGHNRKDCASTQFDCHWVQCACESGKHPEYESWWTSQ